MDKVNNELHQKYFQECMKRQEVPLPNFACLKDDCLFLSQIKIKDTMAEALNSYLAETKEAVDKVFIDDCGMSNGQLTTIL